MNTNSQYRRQSAAERVTHRDIENGILVGRRLRAEAIRSAIGKALHLG